MSNCTDWQIVIMIMNLVTQLKTSTHCRRYCIVGKDHYLHYLQHIQNGSPSY